MNVENPGNKIDWTRFKRKYHRATDYFINHSTLGRIWETLMSGNNFNRAGELPSLLKSIVNWIEVNDLQLDEHALSSEPWREMRSPIYDEMGRHHANESSDEEYNRIAEYATREFSSLFENLLERVENALINQENYKTALSKLNLSINPGTAPSEVVADFLSEISLLYSKMEGSGINFSFEGVKLHENVDSNEYL